MIPINARTLTSNTGTRTSMKKMNSFSEDGVCDASRLIFGQSCGTDTLVSLLEKYCALVGQTLREAALLMERSSAGIVLIVDEKRRLLGTVTDGDLRRALLPASGSILRWTICSSAKQSRLTRSRSRCRWGRHGRRLRG